uniref:Protein FAR1-RELATED SEQUENCE n=1 Tax=Noccaea caerulescens TaxID=107243 RepID=A0A1J3D8E6_NOCCA
MGIDLEMPSGECDDQRINSEINEGTEFESKEEAFELYKEYAKSAGFNTIVKASRRSRMTGKFIDAKFVCTRYGSKKTVEEEEDMDTGLGTEGLSIPQARKRGRINRSSSKTDCKACLHVKRRQDGRWIIRTLVKEHNHETFPSQANSIRESVGGKKLERQNGVIVKEMKGRKIIGLEDGDVERLLNFFTDMQAENPFFFYAIDLSEEQSLRNIFWVDAKGRLDYTCFCDVVSIDTTFIKNEYKLPLVAFIGVNHHGQFLLLGSGLLLTDESKSGFVWLFLAWLKAMHGCQPRVILIKHDQMLKEAVSEAFSSSRHCFYMWDTLGQMPEKLGHVMRQEKGFMDEINEAVYGSCKSGDFEKKWWEAVDKYHVRDNAWLQSLYEDREYWVPVYLKDVSLAGMCTAQRSDSVSAVFDRYIQRKTTLRAFLDQYKSMIQERYEEEEKAEMETLCKQPGLKSPSPFGKQMAEIYTREMFKKFQVEVLGGVACHPKKENEEEEGNKNTFRVQDYEQNRAFLVVWNSESSEVVCSCRLFEFKGFLCRHAMIVLQMSGELTIPSQYVLKRWTKDAKSREALESDQIDGESTKAQRYTDLCLRSLKLSEEASLSEESYNAVMNVLNDAFRDSENTGNLIHNMEESDSVSAQDPSRHEEQNHTFDENVTNTGQEHSLHELWKATALQEQRNRYSILDDYLSAQQMSHEMGQINSMASNRNGYFSAHQNSHSLEGQSITQQRLYGTEQLSFRPEAMYGRLQDMGQSSFRDHPQQHCQSSTHQQSNKNFSH